MRFLKLEPSADEKRKRWKNNASKEQPKTSKSKKTPPKKVDGAEWESQVTASGEGVRTKIGKVECITTPDGKGIMGCYGYTG